MIKFYFIFLCIFMLGCSERNEKSLKKTENPYLKKKICQPKGNQQKLSATNYWELNQMADNLDSMRNPYLIQMSVPINLNCSKIESQQDRIFCIIDQFQKAELPIHVSPNHSIPSRCRCELNDSIFITVCLKDDFYFREEERQYSYEVGKLIAKTDHYYLILLCQEFSVGKNFELITISRKTGKQINQITLGAEVSDVRSVFGRITDYTHFEIETREFDYNENQNLYYFKSTISEQFIIQRNGTFKRIKQIIQ